MHTTPTKNVNGGRHELKSHVMNVLLVLISCLLDRCLCGHCQSMASSEDIIYRREVDTFWIGLPGARFSPRMSDL
uniref:Secreted protein n=1 Tax=Anguilla anguilla TaxID=7936 RepID=A0A0E9XPG0_ANGAN